MIITAHNCVYLWARKQHQYQDRAAPTERLIEIARMTEVQQVFVHCFPYSIWIARYAVELRLGKEVYNASATQQATGQAAMRKQIKR